MEAALILASILALAPQPGDLAASFGFQPLEVQKIDARMRAASMRSPVSSRGEPRFVAAIVAACRIAA